MDPTSAAITPSMMNGVWMKRFDAPTRRMMPSSRRRLGISVTSGAEQLSFEQGPILQRGMVGHIAPRVDMQADDVSRPGSDGALEGLGKLVER